MDVQVSNDALLNAWSKTLARKPDTTAIFATNGGRVQTFRDIESRARQIQQQLKGFDPGSVIAVQIGNHPDWPAIFIAGLRQGLVVLPLEQSISDRQRDAALEICHAAVVVAAGVTAGSLRILPIETSAATTDWDENVPALLKLTSGTTAAPRAIRFRANQLLADCEQICDTMGISDRDLNFGVIPISHSYGFSNLLTPLIVRAVPMVLSQDRTPRAVLADLARTKATVLPATPVFYQSFCEMDNPPAIPALRLCISAGAPLPMAVAQRFRAQFRLSIHTFYGASECGGVCYDREGRNDIEGFVGSPMNNVEIELIVPGGASTQARIRTAATGDGYFPEPEPEKLGKGSFIPDDLLASAWEGFKIVGRISDLINVAGKKVSPAEIEAHLLRCHGVREAVVFGRKSDRRNEEVAACVVLDENVKENDLLEFARRELNAWQVPKRIFVVDSIPANERGKISRRELAKRYGG